MRILSVRIRNLNSLVGDWTIRLDGAEYEAGGIFAITGPTGAGKSTILDAVCLALYGCTPRLGKVAKSGNEIMSRQTADCLAEVRFRTLKGEYLCSWSQNRAGKKLSGNLQQPRHRLYDGEGMSIAEKTTEVTAKVTELTGMDFNRFTQSMLLAQVTPPQWSLSVFLLLLNLPLFLYGLRRQGVTFTLYAVYTVAVYALGAWLITDVLPVLFLLFR